MAQQEEPAHRELLTFFFFFLHLFYSIGSFWNHIMMPLALLYFVSAQQELTENEPG